MAPVRPMAAAVWNRRRRSILPSLTSLLIVSIVLRCSSVIDEVLRWSSCGRPECRSAFRRLHRVDGSNPGESAPLRRGEKSSGRGTSCRVGQTVTRDLNAPARAAGLQAKREIPVNRGILGVLEQLDEGTHSFGAELANWLMNGGQDRSRDQSLV